MSFWAQIDAVASAHGYQHAADYQSLGDCPPHIAEALGSAADARHDQVDPADDDEAVDPRRMAQLVEHALSHQASPPEWLPIRMAQADPPIRVYRLSPRPEAGLK